MWAIICVCDIIFPKKAWRKADMSFAERASTPQEKPKIYHEDFNDWVLPRFGNTHNLHTCVPRTVHPKSKKICGTLETWLRALSLLEKSNRRIHVSRRPFSLKRGPKLEEILRNTPHVSSFQKQVLQSDMFCTALGRKKKSKPIMRLCVLFLTPMS